MKHVNTMTKDENKISNYIRNKGKGTVTVKDIAKEFYDGKATPTKVVLDSMVNSGWLDFFTEGNVTKNTVVDLAGGVVKAMNEKRDKEHREYVLDKMKEWMSSADEDFEKAKETFLEGFQKGPAYELKWHGEDIIRAEIIWRLKKRTQEMFDSGVKEGVKEADVLVKCAKYVKETCTSYLVQGHFVHNSTCPMSNMIDMWECEVYSKILNGGFSYRSHCILELANDGKE